MEDKIAKFLRVDQAGEIGAVRIYQGQLAVLKGKAAIGLVEHMAKQEHHHLATFDRLIEERNTRPTLLGPLWHVAGFALGAATALLGERAAMACTAAVEEVIDDHYAAQAAQLGEEEAPLRQVIEEFQADEREHKETALANGAEQAVGYPVLSALIKSGCRAAIWMAERI
jgi:ubiquinone biosynthesis monooxygenase Coq7